MRVLIFGDSITQGFWDSKGGWVNRLTNHYDSKKLAGTNDDPPTIFNLGVSGDTSVHLLNRLDNEVTARHRYGDIAIAVAIGLNDSMLIDHQESVALKAYIKNLEKIIDSAKKYTDKIVFIGLTPADEKRTTPVNWCNCIYANEQISNYSQAMQKVAQENDIEFIDIFAYFTSLNDYPGLLFDGIHPNNNGHKALFEFIRPKIDSILKF